MILRFQGGSDGIMARELDFINIARFMHLDLALFLAIKGFSLGTLTSLISSQEKPTFSIPF